MTKAEQLAARLDELTTIIGKKRNEFLGSPEDTGVESYLAHTAVEQAEYNKLSRQLRVISDAEMSEWDDAGDLYSIDVFAAMCKGGSFNDDDGFGVYSDGELKTNIGIYPSDITVGNYRKDFGFVIWYNK